MDARRRNDAFVIDALGLLCLAIWVVLAASSRTMGRIPLALVLTLLGAAWCATLAAMRRSQQLDSRALLTKIWAGAILLRLPGLFATPIFEDDYFRYLWDGWMLATTGNPYGVPPAGYFMNSQIPEAMQTILNGINHPELPTLYGPVAEAGFALSYTIAPGALWPWKILLLGAELLSLRLLLRVATPAQCLLFAWCPLLIFETSFNAHPEALGVAAMLAALVWSREGRTSRAAIGLMLAIGVKCIAGVLAPLLFWRKGWKPWAMMLGTATVLWGPFFLQGSTAEWSGLRALAQDWEFNSSLFGLLAAFTDRQSATAITALLLAGGMVMILRYVISRQESEATIKGGLWAFALLLLLSPVVNPWYLLWIVPFVVIRSSASGVAALAACSLSYVHGMNLHDPSLTLYQHPEWLRPLEYGFVAAVAAVAALLPRIGSRVSWSGIQRPGLDESGLGGSKPSGTVLPDGSVFSASGRTAA